MAGRLKARGGLILERDKQSLLGVSAEAVFDYSGKHGICSWRRPAFLRLEALEGSDYRSCRL